MEKDLLKHTDETHPDHQNLSQAHVRIQQVADYVNNSMQMALTNSVILRIQRHLGADITVRPLAPSLRPAPQCHRAVRSERVAANTD
jgi:hypothetical protein